MSSEYQLRKDIDKVKSDIYRITDDTGEVLNVVSKDELRELVLEFAYDQGYVDAELTRNNQILDMVYPVGSIYMSVNSTSPETLFGGSWVQLKDRFLLGRGDTYPLLDDDDEEILTDGEATHTLTVDELPSHNHKFNSYAHYTVQNNGGNAGISYNTSTGTTGAYATSSVGSGQAHNNMPPYLVVYMWKRVEDESE